MQRKSSFQGPCILPEPLWRLCPYRPEQGSRPPGFCGGWNSLLAGLLLPKTCEKIALFCEAVCGKFSRMLWRRCLTPDRAEFSRHAGEVSAGSPAEQPIFEAVFGRSSPARRLFHPPQKPGGREPCSGRYGQRRQSGSGRMQAQKGSFFAYLHPGCPGLTPFREPSIDAEAGGSRAC